MTQPTRTAGGNPPAVQWGLAPRGCVSRPKPRQDQAGTPELKVYPRSHAFE